MSTLPDLIADLFQIITLFTEASFLPCASEFGHKMYPSCWGPLKRFHLLFSSSPHRSPIPTDADSFWMLLKKSCSNAAPRNQKIAFKFTKALNLNTTSNKGMEIRGSLSSMHLKTHSTQAKTKELSANRFSGLNDKV